LPSAVGLSSEIRDALRDTFTFAACDCGALTERPVN
jgi:hypothetical protein